jgi:hypothetical protein
MFSSNDPNQPDDQRLVKAALDCFNDSASCAAGIPTEPKK